MVAETRWTPLGTSKRWSAWHEYDEHESRPVQFYVQVSRTNAQLWIGRHIFRVTRHEPTRRAGVAS